MKGLLLINQDLFFLKDEKFKLSQYYLEKIYPEFAETMRRLNIFGLKSEKSLLIVHKTSDKNQTGVLLGEFREPLEKFVNSFLDNKNLVSMTMVISNKRNHRMFLENLRRSIRELKKIDDEVFDKFIRDQQLRF
jgi:hypothetical protein